MGEEERGPCQLQIITMLLGGRLGRDYDRYIEELISPSPAEKKKKRSTVVVLYSHITFKIDLIIEPLKKRRLLCSEEIHETSKALIQAFPPHHKATKLYS